MRYQYTQDYEFAYKEFKDDLLENAIIFRNQE